MSTTAFQPKRRSSRRRSGASNNANLSEVDSENVKPEKPNISVKPSLLQRPPLTPIQSTLLTSLRSKLEQRLAGEMESSDTEDKTSPSLARLRMTPGNLKEKQQVLLRKHRAARDKLDKLTIGGGISLWPEMDNMRLTRADTAALSVVSLCTCIVTCIAFHMIHGSLKSKMDSYHVSLLQFTAKHPIDVSAGQTTFKASVVAWHIEYMSLIDELTGTFAISFAHTSLLYKVGVVLYISGLVVLLYYLADSIWAKNKLTPRRIKIWVLLLIVMGTWTTQGLLLLISAQSVEKAVENNVHRLTQQLGTLVTTDLDLSVYDHVLTYWRVRSLPPTTHGTLTVLGLFPVRDVAYYLQYYSLPVLTALVTPVVQLVIALKHVYSQPKYVKAS